MILFRNGFAPTPELALGGGEINNSEERGQWVDGRERSRVKDNITLW